MIPFLFEALTFLLSVVVVVITLFLLYAYKSTTTYPELKRHDSEKFYFDTGTKTKRRFPDYLDKPSLDLSVVVPAYNEESRLPIMMAETMEYLEARQTSDPSFTYEVLIVDDGSKDITTEIGLRQSEKYGSDKVRVLTLHKNKGKGGAVRMGVLSSRGKNILFVDADGASKFSDLDKLETCLSSLLSVDKSEDKKYRKLSKHHGPVAVVCGSRAHLEKESIAERSLFRTILMIGFHFVVWFFCVRGIRDTQCGFKLMTRGAALLLFRNLHVERWAFDVDMLFLAQTFGVPVAEVAIQWQEIEGTKMVPVWSWLQMGRDILLIRLRYSLGIWKFKSKFS